MSLAIDTNKVRRVKIGEEWFAVNNRSFDLDSYEFYEGDIRRDGRMIHGGGNGGVTSTGYTFSGFPIGLPDLKGAYVEPLTAITMIELDE